MSGEKKYFRKRFFGGFNREDVVKYISELAKERNESDAAREKAESNYNAMAEAFEPLRQRAIEAEEAMQTAQQDMQEALDAKEEAIAKVSTLTFEVTTLKAELAMAKREAEEGRVFKAEALESRAKVEKLEEVQKCFESIQPHFESLKSAISPEEKVYVEPWR